MGRSTRLDFEGAWQHLMNRGADRQDIFTDDVDHRQFHRFIGEIVDRGLLEIHVHCEMTNHFHLLGRSQQGTVSSAMHLLQSEYARWYNDRHRRTGPLFTSRFTSVLIDNDEQLITAARYVHRNPLAFVSHDELAGYQWSSYPVYAASAAVPAWLTTQHLSDVGGLTGEAMRKFVETDLPSDDISPRRAVRCDASLGQLVATLCCVVGREAHEVLGGSAGTSTARQLLCMLAVGQRIATTAELAGALGLSSGASVRVLARRGRVRSVDDPAFARLRTEILRLTASGYAVPGTA